MKKLILLIVLGVVFFIGGQWLGLEFAVENPSDPAHGGGASGVSGGNELRP